MKYFPCLLNGEGGWLPSHPPFIFMYIVMVCIKMKTEQEEKMIILTRKQREALFKVFQRDFPSWITPFKRYRSGMQLGTDRVPSIQYRRFRKLVQPAFGGECVMLPWHGMWLGIERDGYTHS